MEPPGAFEFPFEPYDSQVEFMERLYRCVENGKLGIFESPTGTGKSMSLICGVLRWLKDHEDREMSEALSAVDSLEKVSVDHQLPSGPDAWVYEQATDRSRQLQLAESRKRVASIRKAKCIVHRPAFSELQKTEKPGAAVCDESEEDPGSGEAEDNDFIDGYRSEEEEEGSLSDDKEDDEGDYRHTQIIYASRTHSQLSQFACEVRRSPLSANVRCVTLASRPQLCVNDSVRRLVHTSLVNQACLDLQQKGTGKTTKNDSDGKANKRQKCTGSCPFKSRSQKLYEHMLSDVCDLEKLVSAGRRLAACPYYASRRAVSEARLILVPYNTLLHEPTRRACGLRLAGNVVLVDEAHNLLETIFSVHACQLYRRQAAAALVQLQNYTALYRSRFAARTVLALRQLTSLLAGLLRVFNGALSGTHILALNDFLELAGVDNLNIRKLVQFAEKTRLAQKLRSCWNRRPPAESQATRSCPNSGLSQFIQNLKAVEDALSAAKSTDRQPTVQTPDLSSELSLLPCLQLMSALADSESAGRLMVTSSEEKDPYIKFLPLDIAARFRDVVTQTRSVVLAGGTMRPVSEFIDQLFVAAGAARDRVMVFSCGHVIPPEQLLPVSLGRGPTGEQFLFTYQRRSDPGLIDELGRVLLNLSRLVPGGIVCFLPSYSMTDAVLAQLSASGITDKIAVKKKVFQESRNSSATDSVLQEYTKVVTQSSGAHTGLTGALLFSVVGGKMSEGINFSDDLGRCVVVVGLPYPNVNSPELKEKMRFLDANMPATSDGRSAGQSLYENLCMKAVNQSIGRAIRHKSDYACVLLCDVRYSRPSTAEHLPDWVRARLAHEDQFGKAFGKIRKFFADMRDRWPPQK